MESNGLFVCVACRHCEEIAEMKKVLWRLAVGVIAVWACAVCHADESADDLVKVKSRGIGVDRGEALKDAFRAAVEQVVGVYVDAEQAAENDELISDRVLVQSNAYIRDYVLRGEKTRGDGLCEVVIVAEVKKQELTHTLKDAMPEKSFSLGDELKAQHQVLLRERKKREEDERRKAEEDFRAARQKEEAARKEREVEESQRERDEAAASLLEGSLKGFDPNVVLIDVERDKRSAPKVLGGEDQTQVEFALRLKVNSDRYFNTVVPRLQRILGQISVRKPEKVSFILEPMRDGQPVPTDVDCLGAGVKSCMDNAYALPELKWQGRELRLRSLGPCGGAYPGSVVWITESVFCGENGRMRISLSGYFLSDRVFGKWRQMAAEWEQTKLSFRANLVDDKGCAVTETQFTLKRNPRFAGWGMGLSDVEVVDYYVFPFIFRSSSFDAFSEGDRQRISNLVRNLKVGREAACRAYGRALCQRFRGNEAYRTAAKELTEQLAASKALGNRPEGDTDESPFDNQNGASFDNSNADGVVFEIPLSCTFDVLAEELPKISTVKVSVAIP